MRTYDEEFIKALMIVYPEYDYFSVDEDGALWAFKTKPNERNNMWWQLGIIGKSLGTVHYTGSWKETLRSRPTQVCQEIIISNPSTAFGGQKIGKCLRPKPCPVHGKKEERLPYEELVRKAQEEYKPKLPSARILKNARDKSAGKWEERVIFEILDFLDEQTLNKERK